MDAYSHHQSKEDSVSLLRSFGSPLKPPPSPRQPPAVAKQDFEHFTPNALKKATPDSSEHSQSRKFAASPLDKIPSTFYTRFPRFDTTTENSSPDLSTEEVTSTRLSVDEHAMMEAPLSKTVPSERRGRRQRVQTALHRAISTPTLGLRRMKDRLRRAPSSTLSGNTLRQEETSLSDQQSQCTADRVSCSARTSPGASLKVQRPEHLSSSALKALESYHTAPDHLSRQASGGFSGPSLAAPDSSLPRSTLSRGIMSGSIEELRSNSFVAASQRAFSFSGAPSMRASQVSAEQTRSLVPVTRPVTLSGVDDVRSLSQLRQDPMFVDMRYGYHRNFIFPLPAEENSRPGMPQSLHGSKTKSHRSLRQTPNMPLLIRDTSIKQGVESAHYQQKLPLYTPAQIITPRGPPPFSSRRAPSVAKALNAPQTRNGVNKRTSGASGHSSSNRLSKASQWSTMEDRTSCRNSKDPSIRSEDPSVKSGDLGVWWKGQRLLAVFKKSVPHRPGLETVTGSKEPCEMKPENDDNREPFKRTCGVYARRMKQKLWGSHLQEAKEEVEGHDVGE